MLDRRSIARAAAAALLSAALAGCSLLAGPWSMRHRPAPPPAPAPAPPPPSAIGAAPSATFKFEVERDDDVLGRLELTHATKDDTLVDIARRFDLGYEEISRANPGVDVWLPGAGRSVVLPTEFVLPDVPHRGIVINIAAMRLYYFPPRKPGEPQVVYTHPIGIGRVGWRTPVGVTKVVRREKNPTWHPPPSIIKEHRADGDDLPAVVGPGPDNPLGDRAFYLAWRGYLIHGTNKPAGVGLRVSHGCIHLFPEDIDALYEKVPIGTPVRVINQPYVFGWHDGRLYMQAYGSLEDDPRGWQRAQQRQFLAKALGPRIERELARRHLRVNGDLVMQLAREPRGIPVPVSEPDSGDAAGAAAGAAPSDDLHSAIAQALAGALQVRNELPAGSNWDGKTDLPADQMAPPGAKDAAVAKEVSRSKEASDSKEAANSKEAAEAAPTLKPMAESRAAPAGADSRTTP